MGIPTRDELLRATDIAQTHEVELPSLGFSVRIRALPAAYSNLANSEATELVNSENAKGRIEQSVRIDHVKLEALKVLHGLVEPKLATLAEVNTFAERVSSGVWKKLVREIDRLSGMDTESVERTEAMFPDGGSGEEGPAEPDAGADAGANGNGGPAVPVRAGA